MWGRTSLRHRTIGFHPVPIAAAQDPAQRYAEHRSELKEKEHGCHNGSHPKMIACTGHPSELDHYRTDSMVHWPDETRSLTARAAVRLQFAFIGAPGFEPGTSCSRSSNPGAELTPRHFGFNVARTQSHYSRLPPAWGSWLAAADITAVSKLHSPMRRVREWERQSSGHFDQS